MDVQKFYLFFSWFVAMKLLTLAQLESRRSQFRIVPRIIGGRDAEPSEFPFVVSLRKIHQHVCGGSILNKHWILTAAHCFDNKPSTDNFQVAVVVDGEEATIHTVNKIISHEKFVPMARLAYDIALVRVSKPIAFGRHVQSISLPKPGTEVTGVVTAVGWGTTEANVIKLPKVLQVVDLTVQPQKDCKKFYTDPEFDTSSTFCAGGNPKQATCDGDSGGPLIQYKNEVPFIAGIVSGGSLCSSSGKPGFYTKVSTFVEWIEKHLKGR